MNGVQQYITFPLFFSGSFPDVNSNSNATSNMQNTTTKESACEAPNRLPFPFSYFCNSAWLFLPCYRRRSHDKPLLVHGKLLYCSKCNFTILYRQSVIQTVLCPSLLLFSFLKSSWIACCDWSSLKGGWPACCLFGAAW
jgi:hypothetical protein